MGGVELEASCGECGGPVHFFGCPAHGWAVASVCLGDCQRAATISRTCRECYWPVAQERQDESVGDILSQVVRECESIALGGEDPAETGWNAAEWTRKALVRLGYQEPPAP
jgi:hypothetical protein